MDNVGESPGKRSAQRRDGAETQTMKTRMGEPHSNHRGSNAKRDSAVRRHESSSRRPYESGSTR